MYRKLASTQPSCTAVGGRSRGTASGLQRSAQRTLPELDCCVAAGDDYDETIAFTREAIAFHLEGLAEAGQDIPAPSREPAIVEYIT